MTKSTESWLKTPREVANRGTDQDLMNFLKENENDEVLCAFITRGHETNLYKYLFNKDAYGYERVLNRLIDIGSGLSLANILLKIRQDTGVMRAFLERAQSNILLYYLKFDHNQEVFTEFLKRATPTDFASYLSHFGDNEVVIRALKNICDKSDFSFYMSLYRGSNG